MKLANFIKNSFKCNLFTICCFVSTANCEKQQAKGNKLEGLSSQTKKEQIFPIENIFSNYLESKENITFNDKSKIPQPKDYFKENSQAFAEDDPWEQY